MRKLLYLIILLPAISIGQTMSPAGEFESETPYCINGTDTIKIGSKIKLESGDYATVKSLQIRRAGKLYGVFAVTKKGWYVPMDDGARNLTSAQKSAPPAAADIIKYSRVIFASDSTIPVAELYSKCLTWLGTSYVSGKAVIDISDRDAGIIIAKPAIPYHWKYALFNRDSKLSYVLKISIKQGKIKVESSDYSVISTYDGGDHPRNIVLSEQYDSPLARGAATEPANIEWRTGKSAARYDFDNTCNSLKSAIDNKSDW